MIVQETYNNNVTLTSFNLGKFKVYFIHYNFSLTLLTVIYSCSSVPFVPNPVAQCEVAQVTRFSKPGVGRVS